jgi:glycosyltransferase involved in cell wall biosynthesis
VKISIVTISFNQRIYLSQAIESVLLQGFRELEYIVVDPGSSDGSRDLIRSYSYGISQMIFEPDRGPSDGLNKGFSRASGEVFGFVNADDALAPASLQRVADFFQQHPDCDLIFGNGYVIDERGRQLYHVRARDFTVGRYLHGGARFLQQSTFFRRTAFDRAGGFNVSNHTCWDGELFVRMVKSGAAVEYIDADLAAFRLHPASISGSRKNQKAYQIECHRIFRDLQERDWSAKDELLRFAYRAEGVLNGGGRRRFATFWRGNR